MNPTTKNQLGKETSGKDLPTIQTILFWCVKAQEMRECSWDYKTKSYDKELHECVNDLCPFPEWLDYCDIVEPMARVFWNEVQDWERQFNH